VFRYHPLREQDATETPARLAQRPQPFDHPDWIFEIKYDGFRALAYIEDGECSLISRKNKRVQVIPPTT